MAAGDDPMVAAHIPTSCARTVGPTASSAFGLQCWHQLLKEWGQAFRTASCWPRRPPVARPPPPTSTSVAGRRDSTAAAGGPCRNNRIARFRWAPVASMNVSRIRALSGRSARRYAARNSAAISCLLACLTLIPSAPLVSWVIRQRMPPG